MAKSVEALVEKELLIWARRSARLDIDEASKKIGVKQEKLISWEEGETRPTVNQLKTIANVYKRPLAVFYLPQPPSKYEQPFDALRIEDFRKLPEHADVGFSSSMIFELRKAEYRREVILDLTARLGITIKRFSLSASLNENPIEVAQRIRVILNINYDSQKRWRSASEALKNWISAIEEQNILVFQTGMYSHPGVSIEEMRGLAISLPILPLILINGKDTFTARLFSLAHEFCHLLLRVTAISDLSEYIELEDNRDQSQNIEIFCNAFAAELLAPESVLLEDEVVKNHNPYEDWTDDEINVLANRFNISKEALTRRLLTIGFVDTEFYRSKRAQYTQEFLRRKEEKRKTKQSGGPRPHHMLRLWHGPKYISTVLDAYYSELISLNEVSDYIGAKMKHIEKLETSVADL